MAESDCTSGPSMDGNFTATECPICMNVFDDYRVPLATPCGHTFCCVCSIHLAQKGTPLVCPLCRETIESVQQLRLNVALRDLIDQVRAVSLRRSKSQMSSSAVSFPSVDLSTVVLEELLDTGAFGEVHRARWRNGVVAVKVIRAKDMTPQAVETFYREVEVMNCLRHPNVVIMLAACTEMPKLGIVMEYVGGGSLYRLLHVRQRKLADGQIKELALDVTHGIQYLHSINIMHRDLKSKNVLLTDTKPAVAKLCDFGLSRMRLETATMTGNIGTAQWTAPEILKESRYTFKADLYSFGIVLVEMVSNQVPFPGMHPLAIVMAVGMKKKKPAIPKNVHPLLAHLIHCCLEWDPDNRASLPVIMSMLNAFDAGDSEQLDVTEKVGELNHQPSFDSLMRTSDAHNEHLSENHFDANIMSLDPRHLEQGSALQQSAAPCAGYDWKMNGFIEKDIDPQIAADLALALQLQKEEQQQANTAGDSDLARQLHHIEGAKADRGVASVNLEGGERLPFHPNGVFLGELRDVIKGKQGKQVVQQEVNDRKVVTSPHSESVQGTANENVEPSACADVSPALSSLIRSPSKSKSLRSYLPPLNENAEAEKHHPKPYLSGVRLFDHNELKQVQMQEKNTLPSWEAVALEQMANHVAAAHQTHHQRHTSEPFLLPSQSSSLLFERSDSGYESREAPACLQQTDVNSEGDSPHLPRSCTVGSAVQKVFHSLKSVPTALKESLPQSWKESIQATWREKKGMWSSLGRQPNWRPPFGGRPEHQHHPSSPNLPRCPFGTNGYLTSKQSSAPDLRGTDHYSESTLV